VGFHAFPIDRVEPEHEALVGRRVALLALAQRRGFAVPAGFVVLKKTFADLVRDTSLKLELPAVMKRLQAPKADLEEVSRGIRALVRSVAIPQGISLDILSNCKRLGVGTRSAGRSATLRACPTDERLSSATLERAVAVTRLSDIEGVVKACWGSVFDPGNLDRIRAEGMAFEEAAPSILVCETVPAESSGIMFSDAPGEPGTVLVEAVWGFHEALSEGEFVPSRYRVPRERLGEARGEEAPQAWEYAQGPQGVLVRREVGAERRARPKLQRLQVEELARAVLELERLVGAPVGVEWAIQGGVVYALQIVPLQPSAEPPGEESAAEEYIAAARAREEEVVRIEYAGPREPVRLELPPGLRRAARMPAGAAPGGGPASRGARPAPEAPPAPSRAAAPAPRVPPAPAPPTQDPPAAAAREAARPARLLPVIRTSLFVELPAPADTATAAHIPHAGVVVDLAAWMRAHGQRSPLVASLAAAATAVFPRPLLAELTDLDPGQYEAMREQAATGSDDFLEHVLGGVLDELALLGEVSARTGATNIHVVVPFVKAPEDLAAVRRAIAAAATSQPAGARHTLVFAEVRGPSALRAVGASSQAPDGIILRAGRFYKALLQQGQEAAPAPGGGSPDDPAGFRPGEFARALMEVTRDLERAGATVLVKLEDEGDLDTLPFYVGLGVDGFIAPLIGAEACARALHEVEAGARPSGR